MEELVGELSPETRYIQGPQGEPGPQGADGYTPQRGVDYWTAEDVQEIKDYIDRELGVIENGAY